MSSLAIAPTNPISEQAIRPLLTLGLGVLAYEVVSRVMQKIAKEFFNSFYFL